MECNVPRGGTSCTAQAVNMGLPADKPEADTPWILRAGDGTLYIYMARYVRNDAYLSRSTDGGVTWSTGMPIYKPSPGSTGIVGTDKSETGPLPQRRSDDCVVQRRRQRLRSAPRRRRRRRRPGGNAAEPRTRALQQPHPGRADGDGGMFGAAHDGPAWFWKMTPGADPSLSSSWSAPAQFADATDETRVASGSSGTYVLTDEPGGTFRHVLIRKLSDADFGPAVEAESQQGYIPDLTEAASGIVAGAWRTNGSPRNRLRFSSSKDGSAFTTQTILLGSDIFFDLDASIANDGKGFVVWRGDDSTINMTSTDPVVDENAPPGTGTTIVEYPQRDDHARRGEGLRQPRRQDDRAARVQAQEEERATSGSRCSASTSARTASC
jgi:hypothetical protein